MNPWMRLIMWACKRKLKVEFLVDDLGTMSIGITIRVNGNIHNASCCFTQEQMYNGNGAYERHILRHLIELLKTVDDEIVEVFRGINR